MNTTCVDLTDTLIAEWAIARLQVEGLRQKGSIDPKEKREGLQDLKQAPELPSAKRSPSKEGGGIFPAIASTEHTNVVVGEHGSYKCIYGKHSGRLYVDSVGVHFESTLGVRERDQWEVRYEDMNRVEKVSIRNTASPSAQNQLADDTAPFNRSIASSKSAQAKTLCSSTETKPRSPWVM